MNAVLPITYNTTRWPGRALRVLDNILMVVLLLAVGVMVSVVSAQVALRYGMNLSIDWADELSRLAFVWSMFLAIPLGVRQGAHIGINVLVEHFPPNAQNLLRRAAAALSGVMLLMVAWAALGVALEQWDELMATLDWSVGWFIVPVGVGALLSGLHLLHAAICGLYQPADELHEALNAATSGTGAKA